MAIMDTPQTHLAEFAVRQNLTEQEARPTLHQNSRANTLATIADHMHEGDITAARQLAEACLVAWNSPEAQQDTLTVLWHHGNTSRELGDAEAALQTHVSAIEQHATIETNDTNWHTFGTALEQARLLDLKMAGKQVEALHRSSLLADKLELTYLHSNTPNHPHLSSARLQLSDSQYRMMAFRDAYNSSEEVASQHEQQDDDASHLTLLLARAKMARAQRELLDPIGAQALLAETAPQLAKLLGNDHPETLLAFSDLATTERALGSPQDASELRMHIYNRFRELYGESHPYTFSTQSNLAIDLHRAGDEMSALAHGVSAYEYAKKSPRLSSHTGMAAANLAAVQLLRSNRPQALTLLMEAGMHFEETLGHKHPSTSDVYRQVNAIQRGLVADPNLDFELRVA